MEFSSLIFIMSAISWRTRAVSHRAPRVVRQLLFSSFSCFYAVILTSVVHGRPRSNVFVLGHNPTTPIYRD